jgi:hypothetical protein
MITSQMLLRRSGIRRLIQGMIAFAFAGIGIRSLDILQHRGSQLRSLVLDQLSGAPSSQFSEVAKALDTNLDASRSAALVMGPLFGIASWTGVYLSLTALYFLLYADHKQQAFWSGSHENFLVYWQRSRGLGTGAIVLAGVLISLALIGALVLLYKIRAT